jgi:CheY-like chemotaxis protein
MVRQRTPIPADRTSVDRHLVNPSPRLGAARRVLVVGDSPLGLSAAVLGLGRVAGWDAATASCARDGVKLAASYRPDAILLDAVMPELDGPATLRALREQAATRHTSVVFLTADRGEPHGLVARGAAGAIGKPFKPEELAHQLSELLGWSTTDRSWL